MSTAFVLSSAVAQTSFTTASSLGTYGISISTDGTLVIINDDTLFRTYTLSTPFSLSSATLTKSTTISASPKYRATSFSKDGDFMIYADDAGAGGGELQIVFLTVPYDTATFSSSQVVGIINNSMVGTSLCSNNTVLFVANNYSPVTLWSYNFNLLKYQAPITATTNIATKAFFNKTIDTTLSAEATGKCKSSTITQIGVL